MTLARFFSAKPLPDPNPSLYSSLSHWVTHYAHFFSTQVTCYNTTELNIGIGAIQVGLIPPHVLPAYLG